jgi:hypothetical protein
VPTSQVTVPSKLRDVVEGLTDARCDLVVGLQMLLDEFAGRPVLVHSKGLRAWSIGKLTDGPTLHWVESGEDSRALAIPVVEGFSNGWPLVTVERAITIPEDDLGLLSLPSGKFYPNAEIGVTPHHGDFEAAAGNYSNYNQATYTNWPNWELWWACNLLSFGWESLEFEQFAKTAQHQLIFRLSTLLNHIRRRDELLCVMSRGPEAAAAAYRQSGTGNEIERRGTPLVAGIGVSYELAAYLRDAPGDGQQHLPVLRPPDQGGPAPPLPGRRVLAANNTVF